MILPKVLQNVAVYLYFVSHITVIPRRDAFLYYRKNQISFYEVLFWRQSKSNGKLMFEWLIVSSLQVVLFGSVKKNVYKTFGGQRNG